MLSSTSFGGDEALTNLDSAPLGCLPLAVDSIVAPNPLFEGLAVLGTLRVHFGVFSTPSVSSRSRSIVALEREAVGALPSHA